MHTTPVSLLERLRRPSEHVSWDRFVALYTPLLFYWARKFGLRKADAADFVQDIFTILVRELPRFSYEPLKRFRGWLWTIVVNQWRTRQRRLGSRPQAVSADHLDVVDPVDAAGELDEAEYQKYLVDRALQLMQAEFQPTTWKACWEYAVVGRPARQVAAELGITVNAVHLAKSRVLRRLRQELAGLLE
jgi:RNA polymerase sigma-70 factor (ECF subfamily)